MADSLVLTGVKQVTKHTGSEMLRVNPKRGGDVHKIKRWWTPNTVNTVYEACTLFKVTQDAGICYLAVKTSQAETFRIRIDLKDNFVFNFYNNIGISRAALFNEDMKLIEHYVFPAISGGKIMTVTPAGAPSRPSTAPASTPAAAPATPAAPVETIQDRAAAADITHVVTVKTYYGNEKYYIDNSRQAEVTANAGETIYFDLSDSSLSGHPLAIYTDDTKTTTVSVGIETSDDGSILLFTPPISGSFSYQCTQHNDMGGDITVS